MKTHSLSSLSNYAPMPVYMPGAFPSSQRQQAVSGGDQSAGAGPEAPARVVPLPSAIEAQSLAAIHGQVAHSAYAISRMMVCYAMDQLDDSLCEAISISHAELQDEKPQRLSVLAAKILAKAHSFWQELRPYGLTRELLHDMEAAIKRLVCLSQHDAAKAG